jgi:flagellar hook-associated protein 1 FlgK
MSTTLLGILNTAQRSIVNNQAGLNVVSNNISNMNSTGYTKQRIEFSALESYNTYNWCSSSGTLTIGSGAEVQAITRNREQALDNYFR